MTARRSPLQAQAKVRSARALLALGGITILMAACTGTTGSPAPSGAASGERPTPPGVAISTDPPPPEPQTAWERALRDTDASGNFKKDAALRLFATAFGPLPGVDVQQDLDGVHDRTVAILAVKRHWDELTADQQAAIDAAVAPPAGATHIKIRSASGSAMTVRFEANGVTAATNVVAIDSATAIVSEWAPKLLATIGGHLGFDLPADSIDLYWNVQYGPGKAPFGDALGIFPGGNYGHCAVSLYTTANVADESLIVDVLGHELFHCFQFSGYGSEAAVISGPQWVVEGQAEWVGGDLSGGKSPGERVSWSSYLKWPQQSLFNRDYNSIGFYEHLRETGTDPWSVFRAMWAAGSNNIPVFQASGADREDFYDTWASSVLRDAVRGPAWTTDGYPGARPTDHLEPISIGMTDGIAIGFSAAFAANDVRQFNVGADMVHITVEGHGRLSDGSIDTTNVGDVWYCIDGHTCSTQCTPGTGPAIAGGIAPIFVLAISGALDGTIATVEAKDIKDVCSTPEPSSDNEFCIRYKAMLAWAAPYQGDVTREVAAGVAQRMTDARPYAPAELVADVDLYIKVYGKFATYPGPGNVPIVGPDAVGIADAFRAMNKYCGIPY